jgi:hypothetical protein
MRKRDELDPRAPDRGLGAMLIGVLAKSQQAPTAPAPSTNQQ